MACAPSAGRFDRVATDGRCPLGWPIGTVEWFGMLTASAVSFALLLTYVPRFAAGLAVWLCAAADD